jgi:hypothetical protein
MQRKTTPDKIEDRAMIDDTHKTTAHALTELAGAKELLIQTATQVKEQGDQIINIQRAEDSILEEQAIAARYIASIHGLFAYLVNKVLPNPSHIDNVKKGDKQANKHKQTKKKKKDKMAKPISLLDILNPDSISSEDRKKLQDNDKMLDEMTNIADDLKQIANEVNTELTGQNNRLDILQKTTDKASSNLSNLNHKM